MPNVQDLRQQNKKISSGWNRLATFWSKKATLISIVLVLLALAPLGYSFANKAIKHKQSVKAAKQADKLISNQDFNGAIQQLIKSYNAEQNPNIKGGIAYKIGVKYYEIGNKTEGAKWFKTSTSDYAQANNKQAADNSAQASSNLEKNIDRGSINPKVPNSTNQGPDSAL
jgi:hypothetical protein